MNAKLSVKPRDLRGAPLRRPLAYNSDRTHAFRVQQVKAWRADLRVRGDALRATGATGLGARAAEGWLAVPPPRPGSPPSG
jgi:hypothetical protein